MTITQRKRPLLPDEIQGELYFSYCFLSAREAHLLPLDLFTAANCAAFRHASGHVTFLQS